MTTGSSPLARGSPEVSASRRLGRGIIPARSGFTRSSRSARPGRTDHPRSRGVHGDDLLSAWSKAGSSPLARGSLELVNVDVDWVRIIPARAGFTAAATLLRMLSWDHPRSRGVHEAGPFLSDCGSGSSPLARGSPSSPRAPMTPSADHPRSRGVHRRRGSMPRSSAGSSPLARGSQEPELAHQGQRRIIPARAGFTILLAGFVVSWWDHPRSRGVHTRGSLESQRRVTLSDLVCIHCRPSARSTEFR